MDDRRGVEWRAYAARMPSPDREPLLEDVRDFRRATTASLNALRADMVDGFTEMRAKFDVTAAGQQHIVDLLQHVIDGLGGAHPA